MSSKLYYAAASFESAALALAMSGSIDTIDLIRLFGVHSLGSVCLALALWATLPAGMRNPRFAVLAYLFLQNLLVPGSPVVLRLAHIVGVKFRQLLEEAPVNQIGEPEYTVYRDTDHLQTRAGRIRTRLTNLKVPAADRLTALLALQETPARASADLLRQLLADPNEDIRLLAYGMLDGKEKKISMRILAEEGRLEASHEDSARFGCHKRLAELYWELSYQRLVEGDMKKYACEQAREHGTRATEYDGSDPGVWYLLLRVAIQLKEPKAAETALNKARELGFADEQLAPYEAELAFIDRRLSVIPESFARIRHIALPPHLASVRKFWVPDA